MFYQFNHLGSPDYLKIEKNQNFSFPLHLHQCFELISLLSGEMRVLVNGKEFLMKEGEAMLIFPNQIHSLESMESEHCLCIFSPRLVQSFSAKVAGRQPRSNLFRPDPYLIAAMEQLEAASPFERKGVLYSLCGQFDEGAEYGGNAAQGELLLKIFSFVEKEFAGDCSLARLSAESGYNYSYLSRYFKKTIGISFNAYVNHYRLSHACYLLENTDESVLQCALDSGFSSLRSFNRSFKEQYAITPTQYRKRNQGFLFSEE